MVVSYETAADFRKEFDIVATASFIIRNGYQRVALQFPDELLKDSVAVSSVLKKEISKQRDSSSTRGEQSSESIRLFVMADTTFRSCCADEVAAMHVDAQCIVHYGHTCLSMTSRLPVWFVFGRAAINAESCATRIVEFAAGANQSVLVLFGLKYVHSLHCIQEKTTPVLAERDLDVVFAKCPSQLMEPSVKCDKFVDGCQAAKPASRSPYQNRNCDPGADTHCQSGIQDGLNRQCNDKYTEACCSTSRGEVPTGGVDKCSVDGSEYTVGGLEWTVLRDKGMESYIILWIGGDDPGLTNISLIFNSSRIVRYDCLEDKIVTDVANQSRLLQRRYYLVERAKDASVVGIVVGTLGVAGYGETIQRIRRMVEAAGKKSYTLVMGKPNPSKLANFPECEVFVLVACPQSALLDSKNYLAPVITPFEAELAFLQGKQWTGAYQLDFAATESAPDSVVEVRSDSAEPRFSFFAGSYVGGKDLSQDRGVVDNDVSSRAVVLSSAAQHALQLHSKSSMSIITTERSALDIKSGAEYLASRTYQGLDIDQDGPRKASSAVVGRKGRAAIYRDEPTNK